MPRSVEIEQYVQKYGEYYRGFITNALESLDICEQRDFGKDVDLDQYIKELIYYSAWGY